MYRLLEVQLARAEGCLILMRISSYSDMWSQVVSRHSVEPHCLMHKVKVAGRTSTSTKDSGSAEEIRLSEHSHF